MKLECYNNKPMIRCKKFMTRERRPTVLEGFPMSNNESIKVLTMIGKV